MAADPRDYQALMDRLASLKKDEVPLPDPNAVYEEDPKTIASIQPDSVANLENKLEENDKSEQIKELIANDPALQGYLGSQDRQEYVSAPEAALSDKPVQERATASLVKEDKTPTPTSVPKQQPELGVVASGKISREQLNKNAGLGEQWETLKDKKERQKKENKYVDKKVISPLEQMIKEYKKLKNDKSDIKRAGWIEALAMLGQGLAQYGADVGVAKATMASGAKQQRINLGLKAPELKKEAIAARKDDLDRLEDEISSNLKMKSEKAKIEREKSKQKALEAYRKAQLDIRKGELDQKMQNTIDKLKSVGIKQTKGQEATDKAFGKDYADYVAGGGFTKIKSNLNKLRQVSDSLKNKDLTGGFLEKVLPENAADYARKFNEDAQDAKDTVEQVIQQSLKLTLGGQFSEKEAAQLIKRSYNPALSSEVNQKRLNHTIEQLTLMAEKKKLASEYFEKNGTLMGFRGELPNESKITKTEVKRKTKDGKVAIFDANTKKFLRYE